MRRFWMVCCAVVALAVLIGVAQAQPDPAPTGPLCPARLASITVVPNPEQPGHHRAVLELRTLPGRALAASLTVELPPGRLATRRSDGAEGGISLQLQAVVQARDGLASYRATVLELGRECLVLEGRVELKGD